MTEFYKNLKIFKILILVIFFITSTLSYPSPGHSDAQTEEKKASAAASSIKPSQSIIPDPPDLQSMFDLIQKHRKYCGDGEKDATEACDSSDPENRASCNSNCQIYDEKLCGNKNLDPGEQCDDGNKAKGDGCSNDCLFDISAATPATCADGKFEEDKGEKCDSPNEACLEDGLVCNSQCQCQNLAKCGDKVIDPGEECDSSESEGCSSSCTKLAVCGNGSKEGAEACDDGNTVSGDGCSSSCGHEIRCGDGLMEGSEICDDGNNVSGDGCSASCAHEIRCGDGIIENSEICDDGNNVSGDGCSASCAHEIRCGDGVKEGTEGCDDGNTVSGDGCSESCVHEIRCGDGIKEGTEGCDDGNTVSGDGCSASCAHEIRCGDGVKEGTEGCDDGNTVSGDGCSSACAYEPRCGDGVKEGAEGCDDGNTVSGDGCSSSCSRETRCGDGIKEGTEGCDDGNTVSDDGCSSSCVYEPRCGDGLVESPETCDDGNTISGDGCSVNCKRESTGPPVCGDGVTDPNETCGEPGLQPCGQNANCANCKCVIPPGCGNGVVENGEDCESGVQECGGTLQCKACSCTNSCESGEVCVSQGQCLNSGGTPGANCGGLSSQDYCCALNGLCGNGKMEGSEGCDDGNMISGDGCSSGCQLEGQKNCTFDSDCPNGQKCQNGSCITPECSADTDCPNGEICRNGSCIAPDRCNTDDDCPSGQSCENGSCKTPGCTTDTDCPSGQSCENGSCKTPGCTTDTDCPSGQSCQNGSCKTPGCTTDTDCPSGQSCENGSCKTPGCTTDTDCPSGQSCENGSCKTPGCTTDTDCPSGQSCQNGSCKTPGCTTDTDCPSGQSCENGSCKTPGCTTDTDCPSENECKSGTCKPKPCNCPDGSGQFTCAGVAPNTSCPGGAPGICCATISDACIAAVTTNSACRTPLIPHQPNDGAECESVNDGSDLPRGYKMKDYLYINPNGCNGSGIGCGFQNGMTVMPHPSCCEKCEDPLKEFNECTTFCDSKNGECELAGAGDCENFCYECKYCGDNKTQAERGETCDDGNNNKDADPAVKNNAKCSMDCKKQCDAVYPGTYLDMAFCDGDDCGAIEGEDEKQNTCYSCHNRIFAADESCGPSSFPVTDMALCTGGIESVKDAYRVCPAGTQKKNGDPDKVIPGPDDPNKIYCCKIVTCGNNAVDAGEECDDGNTADGDGCSSACTYEPQTCDVMFPGSVACNGGDPNCQIPVTGANAGRLDVNGSTCCTCHTPPVCGDGFTDSGEACDDGNMISGDGCSSTCTVEACSTISPAYVNDKSSCPACAKSSTLSIGSNGQTITCWVCDAFKLTTTQCPGGVFSTGTSCPGGCSTLIDKCNSGFEPANNSSPTQACCSCTQTQIDRPCEKDGMCDSGVCQTTDQSTANIACAPTCRKACMPNTAVTACVSQNGACG